MHLVISEKDNMAHRSPIIGFHTALRLFKAKNYLVISEDIPQLPLRQELLSEV